MERIHITLDDWFAISRAKIRSGLSIAFEYLNASFGLLKKRMAMAGYRARKEHERVQEIVRERENHLAKMLADPMEAIVITDDMHRLMVANQAALSLFGVSRKNINKFTVDAFLPYSQILLSQPGGFPLIRKTERRGICQIRQLDGSMKVVEFTFQAHFALGRHLLKFRDVTSQKHASVIIYGDADLPRQNDIWA